MTSARIAADVPVKIHRASVLTIIIHYCRLPAHSPAKHRLPSANMEDVMLTHTARKRGRERWTNMEDVMWLILLAKRGTENGWRRKKEHREREREQERARNKGRTKRERERKNKME